MSAIEVVNLTKRYGTKVAVEDLSFHVLPGRITGLLGPNGSGKSTTMRMMVGLESGEGKVLFDGMSYMDIPSPARHVGVLLDAGAVHPSRSIANHLAMMAAGAGIRHSRVKEVLDLVGLSGHLGSKPKTFSLGMKQRFGIACALLGSPNVLILDEPTNGLDPHGIRWFRSFLRSFAQAGNAVLMSSHLLSELELIADDVVVIGRGRLLACASMNEFIHSASTSQVRVRTLAPERLSTALRELGATVTEQTDGVLLVDNLTQLDIARVAARTDALIYELYAKAPSLEESFLSTALGETEYDAQSLEWKAS